MSREAPREADPRIEPFGQTGVRQYILPFLATASLVLMFLSLGMWYRSHHVVDRISSEQPGSSWLISSIYGRILVCCDRRESRMEELEGNWHYDTSPMPESVRDAWQPSVYKSIGIEWRGEPLRAPVTARGWWLRVRWPLISVVAAVLPVIRVVYVMRQRRRLAALRARACPECGYDLRASPKYCPECGRPATGAVANSPERQFP